MSEYILRMLFMDEALSFCLLYTSDAADDAMNV